LDGQEISFSLASFITKSVLRYRLGPDHVSGKLIQRWLSLDESAFRSRKVGVQQGRSVSADPGRLKLSSFGRGRFRIHRILIHRKERNISGDFAFRFKGAFEYQYPGLASDIADRKLDGA
jgi:hypothetical protein